MLSPTYFSKASRCAQLRSPSARTAVSAAALACAGLLALGTLSSVSSAQEAPAAPAAEAAQQQEFADAHAQIDATLQAYQDLKSYRDSLTLTQRVLIVPPTAAEPVARNESWTTELAYAQPQQMRLSDSRALAVTDGETIWQYLSDLGQYTATPAPESMSAANLLESQAMASLGQHPLAAVFMPPKDDPETLLHQLTPTAALASEERNGQAGKLLKAEVSIDGAGGPVPATIWIKADSNLIGSIELDYTELTRQQLQAHAQPGRPAPKIESFVISLNMADVEANPDLGKDVFTFKPDAEAEKVEAFTMPGAQSTQALIGRKAPPFAAPTLGGDKITLADLRGQVVVLDFWATWCGPCVRAMPHLQALSEQFKDKPVKVLGVNVDNAQALEKVKEFVAEHGVKFEHALDPDSSIAERYAVQGIPTTVVIGKDGQVIDAHVGFNPAMKDQLAATINRALSQETEAAKQ